LLAQTGRILIFCGRACYAADSRWRSHDLPQFSAIFAILFMTAWSVNEKYWPVAAIAGKKCVRDILA
jgi:hypothetical protein